ncbi:MAG: hypothetical protein LAQ30_24365 [Acidobacteriia bacterium]|nr:hypothetical protein [Terriglobia bacterium]
MMDRYGYLPEAPFTSPRRPWDAVYPPIDSARVELCKDPAGLKHVIELQAAETEYCAHSGRFGLLRELGPVGAKLIDARLSSGILGGYRFDITIDSSSGSGSVLGACPLKYAQDGYRSFYADQTGPVHQTRQNEVATAKSELVR